MRLKTIAAFVLLVTLFAGLWEELTDNATMVRWDILANNWFHVHATPAGLTFFSILTQFGSIGVWILLVLGIFILQRRREYGLLSMWVAGIIGGKLIQVALKSTIQRQRPQYAATYLHDHSYSFPSGHAMASIICYPLIAFILISLYDWHGGRKAAAYLVAIGFACAIGFSRIYLGVHYPSDVLAGFIAGAAWLTICLGTRNHFSILVRQ